MKTKELQLFAKNRSEGKIKKMMEESIMKKMGLIAIGILVVFSIGIFVQPSLGQDEEDLTVPGTVSTSDVEPQVTVKGRAPKVRGVTREDNFTVSGTAYTDVAGMSISFNALGGVMVVMFQAEMFGPGRVLLRCVDNGVVLPGPGAGAAPMAIHEGTDVGISGFNFIKKIAAGAHTVKIQTAIVGTDTSLMDERSLVIMYK
jgi:hypothetical protein